VPAKRRVLRRRAVVVALAAST